jgi:hypothetical protein
MAKRVSKSDPGSFYKTPPAYRGKPQSEVVVSSREEFAEVAVNSACEASSKCFIRASYNLDGRSRIVGVNLSLSNDLGSGARVPVARYVENLRVHVTPQRKREYLHEYLLGVKADVMEAAERGGVSRLNVLLNDGQLVLNLP